MPGGIASGRAGRILQAVAGLLSSHLRLFGLELQDEVERAITLLLLAAAGAIFASMFLILLTLLLVLVFWEEHRVAVAATLTLLYGGLALGCLLALRHKVHHAALPFALTTEELSRDRALLTGQPEEET